MQIHRYWLGILSRLMLPLLNANCLANAAQCKEKSKRMCFLRQKFIVSQQLRHLCKGLQRKEGFDYMELKGEHGLDLKTHFTKIHILNAYATLKTRTFYIVEASDRRLRLRRLLKIQTTLLLKTRCIPTSATPVSVKTSLQVTETKEPKQKTQKLAKTIKFKNCTNSQQNVETYTLIIDNSQAHKLQGLPSLPEMRNSKNPGEAIEQSNKATKRTLFPKEPEDQKKTE
ncbi:hypothetical protein Tco_0767118 [Tanacetum coccineum]